MSTPADPPPDLQQWIDDAEADDAAWIMVGVPMDEEEIFRQCWKTLPIPMDFSEFRNHMLAIKREKQRHPATRTAIWFLHSLWTLSGYVSTLFSLTQYRTLLIQVLIWFIAV